MKNKTVNNKKLITSIISVVIIAGMAIQSFATNVDFEAFVKKDEYLMKCNEIDWRIEDIDNDIERLYKYTCTNIQSFGGSGNQDTRTNVPFYRRNTTATYHWYASPVIDFSTEGYLRFNHQDMLLKYGNHSTTNRFEREISAHMCKWRTGVELKPETKIILRVTRTVPNTTAASTNMSGTFECVMGPFKKIPYVTTTGSPNGSLMTSDQFFFPYISTFTPYYAYGTETEPTSWTTNLGGSIYLNNVYFGNNTPAGFRPELRYEVDIENLGHRYKNSSNVAHLYVYNAMTTDVSNRTNVWLRFYTTWSGELTTLPFGDLTMTSWNYNK